MFDSVEELSGETKRLEDKYNLIKVNLSHGDSNEGIWAVPVDDSSNKKLNDDESREEPVTCRVVNMPLGWNSLTWGGLVVARTNGDKRAIAYVGEQSTEVLRKDRENLWSIFEEKGGEGAAVVAQLREQARRTEPSGA